jgi:putative membrane protein
MKKNNYFKNAILLITIVTTLLIIVSCSNNKKPDDTKEVAEEHNDAKFDNKEQERDAQFLVNAAEINLEQIQLGQLAQQNGSAIHVKELGKMMEDKHSKSLIELTALAKSKVITIPTSLTDNAKNSYNKINEKSGNEFDKEYADKMVKGHKDAIEVFEKASTDCSDADIKSWASASLPELREHLDLSIDCMNRFDKTSYK